MNVVDINDENSLSDFSDELELKELELSRYGASDAVVVYPDEYVDFQNHSISIIEEMIQDDSVRDFFHISFTKEAFDSEVARSIP